MTQKPVQPKTPQSPAYWRIEQDLRSIIAKGRWPAGTLLPSRQSLAREYKVGISTIQQAVSNLLADGTLRAEDGRGTFITGVGIEMASPVKTTANTDTSAATATLGILAMMPAADDSTGAASSWVPTIIKAMERRFADAGGTTHFFDRTIDRRRNTLIDKAALSLINDRVDGLVSVLDDDPKNIARVTRVAEEHNVPLVLITSEALELPVPHVFYDNTNAGFQAAQHLLARGYHKIVFLTPFKTLWLEERVRGAQQAMDHVSLPNATLEIRPPIGPMKIWNKGLGLSSIRNSYVQRIHDLALELLQEDDTPCGIIAPSDEMACGVLEAAEILGMRPGEDFGLTGFDDFPAARRMGLTSIRPPLELMGEEAARLMLAAIRGERSSLQVRLRPHLLPRLSTRPMDKDQLSSPARSLSSNHSMEALT